MTSPTFGPRASQKFEGRTAMLLPPGAENYSYTTGGRNVRMILVRGQCPLATRGEEICENLTTKWCILKYRPI